MAFDRFARKYPLARRLVVVILEFFTFSLFHQWGVFPVFDSMLVLGFIVLAIGAVLRQPWAVWFGGLVVIVLFIIEADLRDIPGAIFLGLAGFFFLASIWSHRQWLRRSWRHFRPDDDTIPLEPGNMAAGAQFLWPRSRTAMFLSLGCTSCALAVFELFWTHEMLIEGSAVAAPLGILAAAFWFHGNWIRWYGPLLCLGLAGLCAWIFVENALPPTHPAYWGIAVFIVCAWNLRRWNFER